MRNVIHVLINTETILAFKYKLVLHYFHPNRNTCIIDFLIILNIKTSNLLSWWILSKNIGANVVINQCLKWWRWNKKQNISSECIFIRKQAKSIDKNILASFWWLQEVYHLLFVSVVGLNNTVCEGVNWLINGFIWLTGL